jgi:hypothetical protein
MTAAEIWLRTNRRALAISAIPPAIFALLGAYLVFGLGADAQAWWHWIGGAMILVGMFNVAILLLQLREPRIVYHDGTVLFYLSSGPPIGVPVKLVEAFFLGQGPLALTGLTDQHPSTVNLVARISQRAREWGEREVKPALGRWCEGYVTIRGTWCEPLNGELIRRLNRRLREVTEACDR